MQKLLAILLALTLIAPAITAQTPPPGPPAEKKADPKDPEKAEQEPRPVSQELQKQESQKKDAPPQPQPAPLPAGAVAPATEPEKKEDEKKWDVMNPPGPSYDVDIDVTNGTWLSVDVSPDGKEIAFDLLGDVYTIPVGGGEAKAITSGVAWDMQPRYSPNGKWIAFTSDRSGGDNLWIMNRDGSDPKQVSKETFRLLTQPAWSPDSEFLVGRKHFTSERSLGAGEMWLYHRSGGDGLQLTKKRTDQKDTGEPVFSPDGKHLYFSDDATSGAIFEYSKDVNGQIYVIQRLDRETGEIERFVTGPGGSIRPTPSPDGKSLAFIRRVRYKSTLYVKDLETGRESPLFDGLDRDMQETWAVHGVYPSMAWTPDNKSIVFWAGGKIHRIDVASKQVTNIPFHVKSTRRVQEAVRFPVDVAPKNFDVKMLRWVKTSPNGKQVAYQALGYIYLKDLPNGIPRRLTKQTDAFEFYPSWSRDGKSIVYVTWSDEQFGSVRVAPAAGGEGRAVTSKRGHYIEPSFSPDGTKIVYRTTSDGYLRPNLHAGESAIYVIAASGGAPARVTKKGALPMFGAANDRIYFITFEDEGKRALRSIEIDGSDEREHAISAFATEFAVSPDGKWLAWIENFDAHITPFIATGKNIEIGPSMKSVPVATVTKDAGEYLHWSGDSQRLYWSLGPELFSRDLKDAFAFMEGAPATLPKAPESGTQIGFSRAYDVPSGKLAFTNARVITMLGDEAIEKGTVVVDGNRIVAVGANVAVPSDAKVIDAAGKTIMPGLVDVHWHGSMGSDQIVPQQSWVNYASLGFGVTTIHDPSNDNGEIFSASEMAKAGVITGPRIFSTGTILYGAKAPFKAEINSLDDALGHLRRMKAIGAFSVKSYNQPRRDQRQQVIEAARQTRMMVVPEGGSLFQHNMSMVVDGHTGIEHSIPVARIYDDVLQLWGKTRTGYTPTLVVGYGGSFGENYWYQKTNVYDDPRLTKFVPRRILDARSRRRPMIPDDEFNYLNNARIAKELRDAGVSVHIGAHGQREGLAAHWELWMFSQGGMTPMEVLRAGTIDGARYLGMDKDIGSLEPGKLADLIVLDRNPLEDIRNTHSVRYTIVNGRMFDAATMNELGNHPRTRKPLYFEVPGNETWGPAATEAITHTQD
ncbi:MAG TPA: amidohydrolase family protein [Thermoanaerobaculia bacterium]|jgi:imidazolonepropionase-like amidohydrolase/Tol biopolymer transport system component|nr:amidohydrolase family protein [Thermoanaerobaculia bacterium]